MTTHCRPAQVSLSTSLTADGPIVDTPATIDLTIVDGNPCDVDVTIPLDLGDLGETEMIASIRLSDFLSLARLADAGTWRVGERCHVLDTGRMGAVRAPANPDGTIQVHEDGHGLRWVSAALLARPRTMAAAS